MDLANVEYLSDNMRHALGIHFKATAIASIRLMFIRTEDLYSTEFNDETRLQY